MKVSSAPHFLLSRVVELGENATALTQAADALEQKVARARDILNGRLTPKDLTKADVVQMRGGFDAQLSAAQSARHAALVEQRLLSSAKSWVEQLPSDAEIVAAPVAVDGHDLKTVRSDLQAKRERLRLLRSLPTPAADLDRQVHHYVESLRKLGAPAIRSIDKLSIMWPQHGAANRKNLDGFDGGTGNALLMAAWLDGDRLADKLVELIEAEVNSVCPPAQRAPEIGKLEQEIERLVRIDVALTDQLGDAAHDELTSPEALLQVALQGRKRSAAA
jgi:hypothetical protein